MNALFFHILIGCNSAGSAKVNQELDSGATEVEDSGSTSSEDTATQEDTSSSEPSSEPDDVPVDNDGDGVFEDDCDDTDPSVFPQAEEICDNKDNNCDGQIDENDVCPCPYKTFEGKGYYFCGTARKWRLAVDDCLEIEANLVSISSEEENTFIAEQANALTDGKWWIGLNDRGTEGEYVWESGTAFEFDAWNDGEPNNFDDNENCVEMYSNTGLWNDVSCRNEQGFICSFSLE
tara:strand:+ start:25 stop:726 length:702 start_codon:yes stop_codon:yes gene_type:complete